MTVQDIILKQEVTKWAGASPVYVDFNGGDWVAGFRSKLAAYQLIVDRYQGDLSFQVGFNKNLNCWTVSRVGA